MLLTPSAGIYAEALPSAVSSRWAAPGSAEEVRPPRSDIVDSLLAVGVAMLFWLGHRGGPVPTFVPCYALVLLFLCLMIERMAFPELRRILQSLSAFVLFLAFAALTLVEPITQDRVLRWAIPIVFFFSTFCAGWEFFRRSLGLTLSESERDTEVSLLVRRTFWIPSIVAGTIAMIEAPLLTYLNYPAANGIVSLVWIIPFALSWASVRRFPLPIAKANLQHPHLWRRVFGSPAGMVAVVIMVSLVGFLLAIAVNQDHALWAAIVGILLFQALVVIQVQRWAFEATSARLEGSSA